MPLYLVRWPNLSAALVQASNKTELLDTLDQLSNTEGVKIQVYRGPLFLDFELPVRIVTNRKPEDWQRPLATE